MEAVLLCLVVVSPWLFGAVEPFEFVLDAGLAVLLFLWAARVLLEWRLDWPRCPLALCAAALLLLDLGQVLPLPRPVLARLSPDTARLYDQLLPREPEILPGGAVRAAPPTLVGSTISLYPAATYRELTRLLAWLLLFLVVRQNLATAASLRRLSVAAVVNAALLALFGVIQSLSAPRMIYWSYLAPAPPFGPFICPNHFPFYLNMCAGLGLGLLAGGKAFCGGRGGAAALPDRRAAPPPEADPAGNRDQVRGGRPAARPGPSSGGSAGLGSPVPLLQDPRSLWVSTALALMVAGVALSLSRGGALALLGGLLVFLLVGSAFAPGFRRLRVLLVVLPGALALVGWLGLPQVQARLGTLGPAAAWNSRVSLWAHTLPLIRHFPWWGTGHGSFPYVEPLYRRTTAEAGLAFDHAHNEYLEALVEGGVARLALTLVAAGLVLRFGIRAVRHADGPRSRGLALGALVGVSTVLLHSAVDFGLHTPAVALLATVLCAHLAALGGGDAAGPLPAPVGGGPPPPRRQVLAPALGAAAVVVLGGLVVAEGWRACRAEVYSLRSRFASAGLGERLADLEAAADAAPDSAELHAELGRLQLLRYEIREAQRQQRRLVVAAVQAVTDPLQGALPAGPGSPAATLAACGALSAARQELAEAEEERLGRQHLLPAVRHWLLARDLCPLLSEAHLSLAWYAGRFTEADPPALYLERATLAAPHDPGLWYLSGRALLAERPAQACGHWRRSLELSDKDLGPILAAGARRFTPQQILEDILPDRPEVIMAAAAELFPDPEASGEARPFLEKALALLNARRGTLAAKDWHLAAQIHWLLGQGEDARFAYRAAVGEAPGELDWRCEFAEFLWGQGRRPEALRELRAVLAQQPDHARARELADQATREMGEVTGVSAH
jgi:tetratricopeptide (TPR) repeat protein